MEKEFIECESCLKKLDSPICSSCIHNRTIISELKKRNEKLENSLTIIKDIINLTKE
jgi:hypothetical protein